MAVELTEDRRKLLEEFIDNMNWGGKFFIEYNPIRHQYYCTIYFLWGNVKDLNGVNQRGRVDFYLPEEFMTTDPNGPHWCNLLGRMAATLERDRWWVIEFSLTNGGRDEVSYLWP